MATKQNIKLDSKIIEVYMDTVLEHGEVPTSVYRFCKENKIKEQDFYKHFGSLEGVAKEIWDQFLRNTIEVLEKNKEYGAFTKQEKLLAFFYTLFEVLTLNRSYVLFSFEDRTKISEHLKIFKGLRSGIKDFANGLLEHQEAKMRLAQKGKKQLLAEGIWVQFLFLLKFWMDDSSSGFEKTDMAIEKSVTALFDLMDTSPLESVFDLGKFLYKEKFA